MKTRPIGERFQDGDVTLEVKKGGYCAECYYDGLCICEGVGGVIGECVKQLRSDKTSVSFVKVEP